MSDDRDFYESLPILDDFAEAVRAENYSPLPDNWVVGFSDVVGSTAAIANGQYKAVNMVGAGVIAAVSNALGRRPFPFVFGGDGASLAVSAADAAAAGEGMAAMAAFTQAEVGLDLRVAMIPVTEIRKAGRDVKVARFAASEPCIYAMFAGGGLSWFEQRAKRGEYGLPAAPADAKPDLSGLSCRWGVAPARHGLVLSLIVAPRKDDPRFPALVNDIVRMALDQSQSSRPVTKEGLEMGSPGRAVALEAAALKASGLSEVRARLKATKNYLVTAACQTFNLKTRSFDAARYAAEVVANADFRKFDDGLRMTLDCTPEFADLIETRLMAAEDFANWGLYRQKAAQITCFVPSIADRGHVHFVDGADGGYTMAATAMKARRVLSEAPTAA